MNGFGPLFLALSVKLTVCPTALVAGDGPVLMGTRLVLSAATVTCTLALSLAVLGSVGAPEDLMVPVFVGVPVVAAVVMMATLPSETFAPATEPLARVQVTACPDRLQLQPLDGLIDVMVKLLGTVSVIVKFWGTSPVYCGESQKVMELPTATVLSEAVFLRLTSDPEVTVVATEGVLFAVVESGGVLLVRLPLTVTVEDDNAVI